MVTRWSGNFQVKCVKPDTNVRCHGVEKTYGVDSAIESLTFLPQKWRKSENRLEVGTLFSRIPQSKIDLN